MASVHYRPPLARHASALAVSFVVLLLALFDGHIAHAQQVVANGTVETASGTINTGALGPTAGYALYAFNGGIITSGGPLELITGGNSAYGAVALSGGQITIAGGSTVTTNGNGAYGFYVNGAGSSITATDTAITVNGSNNYGVYATSGGAIRLTGGSVAVANVTNSGAALFAFSGGGAPASIQATDVAITAGGTNGTGVQANAGGSIDLVRGSVSTSGSGGYGLYTIGAGASLTADSTSVSTSGVNAVGAYALQGNMGLTNVVITTTGNGSDGTTVDNASTMTITGGSITTGGSQAFGLISFTGSTLTATNVAVRTTGNSSIGAAAEFGAQIILNGGSITTTGDSSAGLFSVGLRTTADPVVAPAAGQPLVRVDNVPVSTLVQVDSAFVPAAVTTGASLTANGVTVTTSGTSSHGAVVRGGSSLTIEGGSSVTTTGAGSAGLFVSAYDTNPSTVTVSNSSVVSQQSVGIYVTGTMANATLTGSSLSGAAVGWAVVNNGGVGGTLNLTADRSSLTGAALMDDLSTSNVTLRNSTLWTVTGDSNVTSLTNDTSTISFAAPIGDPTQQSSYKMLTVASYVGQGGMIALNTYLDGDTSATDRLVINGTATGNTGLLFTNTGGPGAETANGIMVVQATGDTSSAFTMANPELRAGAYDYRLFQGTLGGDAAEANNWYLRSTFIEDGGGPDVVPPDVLPPEPPPTGPGTYPIIGPEIATYGVVQPMAQQLGRASLGTHDDRFGNLYPAGLPCEPVEITAPNDTKASARARARVNCGTDGWRPAVWGRLFGQQINNRYQAYADPRADGRIAGFQAGFDVLRSDSLIDGHKDYAGLFVGYGNANVDVTGLVTNAAATAYVLQHTGHLNLDAWSGGAYWSHYGTPGWYVDLVLQGTSYGGAASTEFARLDTSGAGFISSLEGGYPIALPQLGPGFVLEPQAQVLWQWVSFDARNDGFGPVALGTASTTTARLGLKGKWTIITDNGQVWQPYVRANYWSDFGGNVTTLFGGDMVPLISHAQYMDINAGLNTKVNTHLSAFVDVGYQFAVSDDGGGRRDGVKGSTGLRYQW